MTNRRLRSVLAGRGFMLFPAAAFAVHQLRYQLAYGSRTGAALSAQGHGYLTSLAPWVAVLLALAAGSFLARLARTAGGTPDTRPRRAFRRLWFASSLGLLAAYSLQELLEGVFAAGHPGGIEGVFGHGGSGRCRSRRSRARRRLPPSPRRRRRSTRSRRPRPLPPLRRTSPVCPAPPRSLFGAARRWPATSRVGLRPSGFLAA